MKNTHRTSSISIPLNIMTLLYFALIARDIKNSHSVSKDRCLIRTCLLIFSYCPISFSFVEASHVGSHKRHFTITCLRYTLVRVLFCQHRIPSCVTFPYDALRVDIRDFTFNGEANSERFST